MVNLPIIFYKSEGFICIFGKSSSSELLYSTDCLSRKHHKEQRIFVTCFQLGSTLSKKRWKKQCMRHGKQLNPLMPGDKKKGHTYLNKPAAEPCKVV